MEGVKMPRPRKCRKVCYFPQTLEFAPVGDRKEEVIILTIDEYETIRLIDKEGLSQEQCGEQMEVSRTTVQLVYSAARKKLADALVDGCLLRIEGGEYQLCNGEKASHSCCGCFKYHINQQYTKPKGELIMRIAVTFENNEVFQHFGHTEQFKVYDVEDKTIVSSEVVDTNGQGHGALAGVLKALNVDVLICGGIGGGARTALDANGIKLYGGVSGSADEAVKDLLAGKLSYNPEVCCNHHGHEEGHHNCEHHGEQHGCGHNENGHCHRGL